MADRLATEDASQCASCAHWRRKGGLVRAATTTCTVLDDASMDAKARLIVVAMARTLAQAGTCPTYAAPETFPDSYRAEDLPAPVPSIREKVTGVLGHLPSHP